MVRKNAAVRPLLTLIISCQLAKHTAGQVHPRRARLWLLELRERPGETACAFLQFKFIIASLAPLLPKVFFTFANSICLMMSRMMQIPECF